MKLEIYKDKKGEWRWRVISKGRIVAESGEGYKRKSGLLKTLKNFMKTKIKLTLLAALLCFAGNSQAANWIGFAQSASESKAISVAVYPLYAPEIEVNGRVDKWGLGAKLTYPINNIIEGMVGDHTYVGVRGDFLSHRFFASSVTGGIKAHFQLFGRDIVPYIESGAFIPLAGGDNLNNELGAIYGGGWSTRLLSFGKVGADGTKPGTFDLGGGVEKWTQFPGQIYHIALIAGWKF